jgi:general secretion pathway protein L
MITSMHWSGATHCLVDSEDVLLTQAAIPSKQRRQVLQAVPYMVEEQLAQDVEECHFAVGPRTPDGRTSVAVIDRARLAALVEQFTSLGIALSSVTPDVLCVPFDTGVHVLIDESRALIRTGPTTGVSVEAELLPVAISMCGSVDRISVHLHPTARSGFELQKAQIEAGFDGELTVHELDVSPFECLCMSYAADSIDLLQGEFEVAEETARRSNVWRPAVILAGCAFGLHIMLLIAQGIYLDIKATRYEREVRALYADVFPNDRNVRDIRRRWEAHLRADSGSGSGEFFELFGEAASHLPGFNLELQNVNFNENRGDVILQLTAPRSEDFVVFAMALVEAGLMAEVGTINQDSEMARGSIKVRLSGDS